MYADLFDRTAGAAGCGAGGGGRADRIGPAALRGPGRRPQKPPGAYRRQRGADEPRRRKSQPCAPFSHGDPAGRRGNERRVPALPPLPGAALSQRTPDTDPGGAARRQPGLLLEGQGTHGRPGAAVRPSGCGARPGGAVEPRPLCRGTAGWLGLWPGRPGLQKRADRHHGEPGIPVLGGICAQPGCMAGLWRR